MFLQGNLSSSVGWLIHVANGLLTLATPVYVMRKKYEFIGPRKKTEESFWGK